MSINANPIPGKALLSPSNRELCQSFSLPPNEAVEAERDEILLGPPRIAHQETGDGFPHKVAAE